MLDKQNTVKVTNRSGGAVLYEIPDLGNLRRRFEAGETKEVSMEELQKLSYIPGGQVILDEYLKINGNPDEIYELVGEVEPEYFYTEDDVRRILLTGSNDELLDCLDFAPTGIIELIKKIAVEEELNDVQKRKSILEKTGFSVDKAIYVNHETSEENATEEKTRRVSPAAATSTTTGRRVATPAVTTAEKPTLVAPTSRYKVVSK